MPHESPDPQDDPARAAEAEVVAEALTILAGQLEELAVHLDVEAMTTDALTDLLVLLRGSPKLVEDRGLRGNVGIVEDMVATELNSRMDQRFMEAAGLKLERTSNSTWHFDEPRTVIGTYVMDQLAEKGERDIAPDEESYLWDVVDIAMSLLSSPKLRVTALRDAGFDPGTWGDRKEGRPGVRLHQA